MSQTPPPEAPSDVPLFWRTVFATVLFGVVCTGCLIGLGLPAALVAELFSGNDTLLSAVLKLIQPLLALMFPKLLPLLSLSVALGILVVTVRKLMRAATLRHLNLAGFLSAFALLFGLGFLAVFGIDAILVCIANGRKIFSGQLSASALPDLIFTPTLVTVASLVLAAVGIPFAFAASTKSVPHAPQPD
jgi:hypothetical protein